MSDMSDRVPSPADRKVFQSPDYEEELPKAETLHEQVSTQRHIAAADRRIDELVYELHGLAEEEIGIVGQLMRMTYQSILSALTQPPIATSHSDAKPSSNCRMYPTPTDNGQL